MENTKAEKGLEIEGVMINNLLELKRFLANIDNDVFNYYFNFAISKWIKDSLDDKELAKSVKRTRTKQELIEVLHRDYIYSLIDKTYHHLDKGEVGLASSIYNKICSEYNNLSEGFKREFYDECKYLHNLIENAENKTKSNTVAKTISLVGFSFVLLLFVLGMVMPEFREAVSGNVLLNSQVKANSYDVEKLIDTSKEGVLVNESLVKEIGSFAEGVTTTKVDDSLLIIEGDIEINKPVEIIKVKKNLLGGYTYERLALEPPQKRESSINRLDRFKQVLVYSNASIHYYNVKTFTDIPEDIVDPRLYHVIGGFSRDITYNPEYNVMFFDSDDNGAIDRVEWIVPRLSEQLFEVGEGAGTRAINLSVLRSVPSSVGANTNFTVLLAVYNKGDITAYNVTINETMPGWTVVDNGSGSKVGNNLIFVLGDIYPDYYKTVKYVITSNSSGIGSFRWYGKYQNSTNSWFTVNESQAFVVNVTSNPAYQFNITPDEFDFNEIILFNISVKNIGASTIAAGSFVRITFPDNNWNITDFGGGTWNSTNRSITWSLSSSIAVGGTALLNFSAIVNESAAYSITIKGSYDQEFLSQGYTDNIAPDWGIYGSDSDTAVFFAVCSASVTNETTESYTFNNTPPSDAIEKYIQVFNTSVFWDTTIGAGDTLTTYYDDVDVYNDNDQLKRLFNISDKSGTNNDFNGWSNRTFGEVDLITEDNHDYRLRFSATSTQQCGFGSCACNIIANLTVREIKYRWNYTLRNWNEQELFVRSFGVTNVTLSQNVLTAVSSDTSYQFNITLSNTFTDTAVLINLTQDITDDSCSGPSPYFTVNTSTITQGNFSNVSYNSTTRKISWKNLVLQPNEQQMVFYNLTSPICFDDKTFVNAFNATANWSDERTPPSISSANDLRDIKVLAKGRANMVFSIVPSEITMDYVTRLTLILTNNGEDNMSDVHYVNVTIPTNYVVDESTISNGGVYNDSLRIIEWQDIGGPLYMDSTMNLTFNATSNTSGIDTLDVDSIYEDQYGNRTSGGDDTVKTVELQITSDFNPNPISPDGTTTLTVTITNNYANTITNLAITPDIPQTWRVSPTSQSISSLASSSQSSRQFLVTVNSSTGVYNINSTVEFTDPNSITATKITTTDIEMGSKPLLVIIREIPPFVGNNINMLVRFYIYNYGNDPAYNTNLTEYLDTSWFTNGNVSPLDGGVSNMTADTVFWDVGTIQDINYSLVRYYSNQSTTGVYWFNSTARFLDVASNYNYSTEGPNSTVVKSGGTYEFDIINRTRDVGEAELFIFNSTNIGTTTLTDRADPSVYVPSNWNVIDVGDGRWIANDRVITWDETSVSSGVSILNNFTLNTSVNDYYIFKGLNQNLTGPETADAGSELTGSFQLSGGNYSNTWANNNDYWYFGDITDTGTIHGYGVFVFDISSLDVSKYLITNMTFMLVYCHDGSDGSPAGCDGDSAEGAPQGDQDVELWNNTGNSWDDIGNLRTNDGGNEVSDRYGISGDLSDYVNDNDEIKIRYECYYENNGWILDPDDSWIVFEHSTLNLTFIDIKNPQNLFILAKAGIANVSVFDPQEYQQIYQGDLFTTNATVTAINGNILGVQAQIIISGALSLPNSDPIHNISDLNNGQSENTTWNVSADVVGVTDITVVTSATAGSSSQDSVYVNVTEAINITSVNLSQTELEPGDNLSNITVSIKNLAKTTHNITTTINIFNSTGQEQSFGPLDYENITNTSIATGQTAKAVFDNSSYGYTIHQDTVLGNYTVRATSTPDSLDSVTRDTTFRILQVVINSTVNDSLILPGESMNFIVNISNVWSSAVNYNVTIINITYQDGSDVTDEWSFNPALPENKTIAANTNDTISFVVTSPSENDLAKAGNYTINASVVYIDPNGRTKTKHTTQFVEVNESIDYSVGVFAPNRLPLSLTKRINVTINNLANVYLEDVNVSLLIYNSTSSLMSWTIVPSVQVVDIVLNKSNQTHFNITVPANAILGEYNITAVANYTSYSKTNYTLSNVTQDIFITSIQVAHSEYEAGDLIEWINATINNTGEESYVVNSSVNIFDSSYVDQSFGPLDSEINVSNITSGSFSIVSWNNNSAGYYIAAGSNTGAYIVQVNSTWGYGAKTYNETSFEIVLVDASSSLNISDIDLFENAGFNISILNNFSSLVGFNISTEVWDFYNKNDTGLWTIEPRNILLNVSGRAVNSTIIDITPPNNPVDVESGVYTIKAIVNYTDPNGFSKQKTTNSTITMNAYKNISASINAPDMPKGVDSDVTITINNIGNVNLSNVNLTLKIYNSTGFEMNWNISPSENQSTNISFNSSDDVVFTVSVPSNTIVGNYSANVSIDFDGNEREYLNVSDDFEVTEDISLTVTRSQSELEPGDIIDWINVNVTNINDVNYYNVSVWIDILDSSQVDQDFGPNGSEINNVTNIAPINSVVLSWNNSGGGYEVNESASFGAYTIKATGNITNIGALRYGATTLKLVGISKTDQLTPTSIGINESSELNITISNGFSSAVQFNVTDIIVLNSTGSDVTVLWTISPSERILNVGGSGSNTTSFTITSPESYLNALPDNYSINYTYYYTDPNGRSKNKTGQIVLEIEEDIILLLDIISPEQTPIGLDSEFTLNVTNVGNVPASGVNVSLVVGDYAWTVIPSSSLVNIGFNGYNSTNFNVSVPANSSLGGYPINATAIVSDSTFYRNEEFNVTKNIFTRSVFVNLTELEPGGLLGINTTIENTHQSRNVNVTVNISILDSAYSLISWTPEDNVSFMLASSNTSVRFNTSVASNASAGNYTVLINSTYGSGAYSYNTTFFTVSTIVPISTATPPSVDWNETSIINTTLNNTWFSKGFNVSISIIAIINESGGDAWNYWNVDYYSRNVSVLARGLNYTEFRANTSNATRGEYNFTIEVNYTDPNTNNIITKQQVVTIGVGLAEVNAYYTLPTVVANEEIYYVNATVANIGGFDLDIINVSLYIENNTKQWWFIPISYQIPELNMSDSNVTLASLFIPKNIAPGTYNATVQVNYTDQDGLNQTRYFRQEFILYRGIDVNILVDGYEYALVKPNQSVNITINVMDSTDQAVNNANISLMMWSFDGRSWQNSGITNASGNYTFAVDLNESEGGYYISVNVTTSSYENESNEGVFLADDDKSLMIVVDDDTTGHGSDNNDEEIASAISSITSIDVSYIKWNTSSNGSPNASNMSEYDAVMWSLGDHMLNGILNDTSEVDEIISYVERGGGFFLESGGLAYTIYVGIYNTDERIFTDVLKVELPSADPQLSGTKSFDVVKDHYHQPLIDGYGGEMNKSNSISKLYKDKINPNATLNSRSLMKWQSLNDSAGVFFDERSNLSTDGSKTIYYSFPIDGLASSEMNKLVKNAFMWLVRTKLGVFVKPNASEYILYSGYSDEAEIRVYVKDHDSEDLTNLTSGVDINATLIYPNGSSKNITMVEQSGYYVGYTNFTQTGSHTLWVNASRVGNLLSYGFVGLRVTEKTPPSINLIGPENNTWNDSEPLVFYYNVTDLLSGISSCSLIINGVVNLTNTTVNESITQNFTVYGLGDGSHSWYINCSDDSPDQNENASLVWVIKRDTTDPQVVLDQPHNDTWDLDGTVQMSYIPYDENINVCQLWGNFNGSFVLNQTENDPDDGTTNWFNAINLLDGIYVWNVWCNDSVNRYDWGDSNFTIKIDTSPPSINLEGPENNSEWNTSKLVLFEYNVIDNMTTIANCSLIINGEINGSPDTSVDESVTQNFTRNLAYNQTYNWSINCTDSNWFENGSLTYNFTLRDRESPVVTLIDPPNGDNDPDGNITFKFKVTDNFGIANCTLYTNISGWGTENTTFGVQNNTVTNFTKENIPENTTFIWNVLCYDYFDNFDWGDNNWSVIIGPPPVIYMNITIPARITILNNPPEVRQVVVVDPITLEAGTLTKVSCNGTIYDPEGYQDIAGANATLYDSSESALYSSDNNTNHYKNTSCIETGSDSFTKDFTCDFDLWYFANNGSWVCNITGFDSAGFYNINGTTTIVNPLFAIDVTPVIDYGILDVLEISSDDEIVNVTNIGNVETDIAIKGYAASDGDGWAMNCSNFGNISLDYERYSLIASQGFDQMSYNLSSDYINITDFNLAEQVDVNQNSTKSVYWKLQAPVGTSGFCRGTVVFSALS